MSFIAVAAIGTAVIGGVFANEAADEASDASRDATQAQVRATRDQIAAAERQYQRTVELFSGYLRDGDLADAWLRALYEGTATYTPSTPGAQPVTITRAQVMEQIDGTPMMQAANEWLEARNTLDEAGYEGARDLAAEERADLEGTATETYDRALAEADAARTGRRGESQAQLEQRLANNATAYAAWDAQARDEADRAVDATFSRGGVTGLVGQTRAGVADIGQRYALDAYGRRTELDAAAYDPYFDQNWATETGYYDTRRDAGDTRGAANTYAAVLAGQRGTAAYDDFTRNRRGAYDAYTGDVAANYADFIENNLGRRSSRGQSSRNVISGAGEGETDRISSAYRDRGDAIARGAEREGAIQQQRYADFADLAGSAVGAIWNRKR